MPGMKTYIRPKKRGRKTDDIEEVKKKVHLAQFRCTNYKRTITNLQVRIKKLKEELKIKEISCGTRERKGTEAYSPKIIRAMNLLREGFGVEKAPEVLKELALILTGESIDVPS